MTVPSHWNNVPDWQRQVAAQLNPLTQGYLWQQFSNAPSPNPNEGYSYYDLTLGKPGWFNGSDFVYPLAEDASGDVSITGSLSVGTNLQVDGDITVGDDVLADGDVRAGTAFGFSSGAGGTVTQSGSKSAGVTLHRSCGRVTLDNAALPAGTAESFTFTNSRISAGDVIIMNHQGGGTLGAYAFNADTASGNATITVRNLTAGSLSQSPVIGFCVIKSVIS